MVASTKQSYAEALAALKLEPANADFRSIAREIGYMHAKITRSNGIVPPVQTADIDREIEEIK